MLSLPVQRRIDRACFPGWPAPHDREIFLLEPVLLHEQPKFSGRGRSFGHEHKPARFPVETVDDGDLAAVGYFEGEQLAQFIPQGGLAIRPGRMDEEERRLVYDDVVLCLVNNREIPANSDQFLHVRALMKMGRGRMSTTRGSIR